MSRGERAGSVLESSAFDVRRLSRTTASEVPPEVVFSAHLYHDAAMAVVKEGRVVAVLELERIFQVRYFEWVQDREHEVNEEGRLALHSQLDVSIGALRAIAAKEIPRGTIFDLAVTTHCPQPCVHQTGPCLLPAWQQVWSYMWRCLLGYTLMSQLLPVREWRYAEHHRSHAALGFYDSPYALDVQRTPHTELSVCSSWGVLTGLIPLRGRSLQVRFGNGSVIRRRRQRRNHEDVRRTARWQPARLGAEQLALIQPRLGQGLHVSCVAPR